MIVISLQVSGYPSASLHVRRISMRENILTVITTQPEVES